MACVSVIDFGQGVTGTPVTDLDNYSRFIENVLRHLPGITSIRSNLSLREVKSSNQLPILGL